MKITEQFIKNLIHEEMEDMGTPIPPEELHGALSAAIYDLYKYVNGIRPRWIKFDEMSVEELENMHHELTAELEQQAQGEEARSYKPDYDPSEYTRGLEDRYISDHDAYEAEQELMMTPEEGEEFPQRQGMGRRPLVGPARDVRRGRRISEQLKKMIKEEIESVTETKKFEGGPEVDIGDAIGMLLDHPYVLKYVVEGAIEAVKKYGDDDGEDTFFYIIERLYQAIPKIEDMISVEDAEREDSAPSF